MNIEEILCEFKVATAEALHDSFIKADQEISATGRHLEWDYHNPNFRFNKIYQAVSELDEADLDPDDLVQIRQIRRFWNHHAVSAAIYKFKDKKAALQFSEVAYAFEDCRNEVTVMYYYLLRGMLDQAENLVAIAQDNSEVVHSMLQEYKSDPYSWLE